MFEVFEDFLKVWGSAGQVLEVAKDQDTDGELAFTISGTEMDAYAYLGRDDRVKLIEWLQGTL